MKIYDLEQQIMRCWAVTDDIEMVTKHFIDDPKWQDMSSELADAMMNKYFAIQELYELKFEALWSCFEEVCAEKFQKEDDYEYQVPKMDESSIDWSNIVVKESPFEQLSFDFESEQYSKLEK